jgi:hypothetical protein
MKSNSFVDPVLGSFVYQIPGGVTLAYDLRLGRTIDRWKDLSNEYKYRRKYHDNII